MVLTRAFIALGSNLGDGAQNLREAARRLAGVEGVTCVAASRIYATPPWGKYDQPGFANAVILIKTSLEPEALLAACLGIEARMGRVRLEKWGPRLIDLDVLLYGERIMDTPSLTLPHPAMLERAFVLRPLKDIAPGLMLNDAKTGLIRPIEDWLSDLDEADITVMTNFTL